MLDCLVKNKMKQELPAWPITINPKFNMYKFNMYIFYKKKCLHYVKMQLMFVVCICLFFTSQPDREKNIDPCSSNFCTTSLLPFY